MGATDGARSLVSEIAARLGDRALLWRGPDLGGRDIDLLVLGQAEAELAEILAGAGLSASSRPDGRTVWSADTGPGPTVDVMPSGSWPRYYPGLPGLAARASRPPGLPPVASPEDRLLMLAAEVVAGRSMEKSLARARRLLEDPDVGVRLPGAAEAEGLTGLADLISTPDRLARLQHRDRLGYRSAAAAALRCRAARAALAARLRARLARLARLPAAETGRRRSATSRRVARKGLLIAISGMDGAGKSTAATAIHAHLEDAHIQAAVSWGRLGARLGVLDSIAPWVKRLLRRQGTIADPVAAGSPLGPKRQDAAERQGRRRPVSWGWILLVAAMNARYLRRAVRARRRGTTVVCDRWAVDSLVDLELRYGRHRFAERVLSKAAPRPDLGILLHVDAASAHARQPGDQARWVLEEMERRYTAVARRHGFIAVDAGRPLEDVERTLRRIVDALIAQRRPATIDRLPDPGERTARGSSVAAQDGVGTGARRQVGEDRA